MLQILVFGMAVLIFVGLGAVVWGIFNLDRTAGLTDAPAALSDLSLNLPAGCAIADMTLSGNRLAVRITGAAEASDLSACERIVIVDLARGAVVGTVAR